MTTKVTALGIECPETIGVKIVQKWKDCDYKLSWKDGKIFILYEKRISQVDIHGIYMWVNGFIAGFQ